jgi:hypothetical protein
LTACSLRARVDLFSCRRRSWDSPFGVFPSRKVARRHRRTRTHLPFLPTLLLVRNTKPARRTAAPGLCPSRESLATGAVLAPRPLATPLGFAPSRVLPRRPEPGFRPASSHALFPPRNGSTTGGAPESRSVSAWSPLSESPEFNGQERQPSEGFRTSLFPGRSNRRPSGLWVHLVPRRTLPPTRTGTP